jgi:hypothetical protein
VLGVAGYSGPQPRAGHTVARPVRRGSGAAVAGQHSTQRPTRHPRKRCPPFPPEAVRHQEPAFHDASAGWLQLWLSGASELQVTGWWDTWERHKEPLESLMRVFNPWSTLPIGVRIVLRRGVGVPEQVFETSAAPLPVLRPDLAGQLA